MAFAAIVTAFTPEENRYAQGYNRRQRGRPAYMCLAIMKVCEIIGKLYKTVVPPIRFLRRYLLVTFSAYRYNFRRILVQAPRPAFSKMPSTFPKVEPRKAEISPDKSSSASHGAPIPGTSPVKPNNLHFILSQHALFTSLIQHLHYHEVLALLSITPYAYSLLRGPNALPISTFKMHSCIPETRKQCWACQTQICTDWERTITVAKRLGGSQQLIETSGQPPTYKSRLDPGHPWDYKPSRSPWNLRLPSDDPAPADTTSTKTIIEQGCKLTISAPNPPSQYHLQHCRPICTSCFYKTVCRHRRAGIVYPLPGSTSTCTRCKCLDPKHGLFTRLRKESKHVCKACHRYPEAAERKHEAPLKAQLYESGEGLFDGECTDCGLKFDRRRWFFGRMGRGIRWWRCGYCGGECRAEVHRRWRGWFEWGKGDSDGNGNGNGEGKSREEGLEGGMELREGV